MPAAVPPSYATEPRDLDAAVQRLRAAAPEFAEMPLAERIALAHAMHRGAARVAERLVRASCAAKGVPFDSPQAGEEWLSGPYVIARVLRQLARALTLLERNGNIPIGRLGETSDGRLAVRVFPGNRLDHLLFPGVHADVHLQPDVTVEQLHATRASFYRSPPHGGRVCLVLGAGNVNSIPPTDLASKLFNEGKVCLLKMNPVNAYVGPLIEEAFADAIERGFLAVVYGGAEEGAYLARHPGIDELHITGSDRTHDLLVWGPPGPERAERMARGAPLLAKPITSELGNVSPVLVVPGDWDARTLAFQAEDVAGMVTHNASFNCNAAKMLVTARGWRQRDAFLAEVERFLALAPARSAWYPGAFERYRALTEGRPSLRQIGEGEGALPWTLVVGLDPGHAEEPAFRTEPFCSILSETSVGSDDPVDFLARAVAFANERLWGTLSAQLLIHPRTLADPAVRRALDGALRDLRYGTVAVNCWAGYGFAAGTTPWGAYPGAPLTDIQSGRGFVHNTLMLEGVEKTVFRYPAIAFPKPPHFPSHRTANEVARRLVELEAGRGWRAVPGLLAAALRG